MSEINKTDDKKITLGDMLEMCRKHWKWFAISLFVILGYTCYSILKTEPKYARTATILVKEGGGMGTSDLAAAFGDFGGFSVQADVNNELAAIQSPAIALKVIEDIKLNISYQRKGTLKDVTLYGPTQPFVMEFPGMPESMVVNLKGTLTPDGAMHISEIYGTDAGDKYDFNTDFKLNIADCDTLETPVGPVVVAPNPAFVAGVTPKDAPKPFTFIVTWRSAESCIQKFMSNMKAVIPDNKASVIDITYVDVSRLRAVDVLNDLIRVYNESWMTDKNAMTAATSEFVDQRLTVIEQELRGVDREISAYKQEKVLPDIQASVVADMTKLTEGDKAILDVQSQLTMARNIYGFIQDEANADKLLPVFSITGASDTGIDNEISDYNKMMMDRNRLSSSTSVNNPMVLDYDSRLKGMRHAIGQSIGNRVQALETRLNDLLNERKKTTGRIAQAPLQANDLLGIERQQKVKEALYLFLLEKREENDLSRAFTAYNVRLLTPPMGSNTPIAPTPIKSLVIAFIFAMILPIALLYIKMNIDTAVRTREDVDTVVKAPFLGCVPLASKGRFGFMRRLKRGRKSADEPSTIVVEHGNGNPVNEAFRMIRSNFDMMNGNSKAEDQVTVAMITSAIPGSGKTFVALNLASTFALKKRSVVVVDVDLRKGTLSKIIGSPIKGITTCLAGRTTVDEAIVHDVNGEAGFDMLPAGALPPNPAELLDTPEFGKIIEQLRKRYDVVILDCPPTEPVTDSQLISKYVDGTVYVVRSGNLKKAFLPVLQRYYEEKRFANLAVVLNAVKDGANGSSGYGYGYGNTGKK